jgi:hypothetical protein
MSKAKTQKEAESAFNKIYNSLFILGGTGHSFVKGKTNVKAAQKSEGKADGSGYLYSSFWPFKPKKAEAKPTETVKPVERPKATRATKPEYNRQDFKYVETDNPTQTSNIEAGDIGLSVSCGGYIGEIGRLSKIDAPDVRNIKFLTEEGLDFACANTGKAIRCYDAKQNVTVVAYYRHDNGIGVDGIYIPGKISQSDANSIMNMIRNKYCEPLTYKSQRSKFDNVDWKAVQQEIADFLNKGGVKASSSKPTESVPKSFDILTPNPTVQPFQPKSEQFKPTTFTSEPAKTIASSKATEPTPPQSIKRPEVQNDLKFGGLYTTPKISPKSTTQTGKPFLTESETALMEQHIDYMPEKLKNAIKAGFDDLGAKLQKGDPSPNILQDSCDAIAQKTGLSASMIMIHMKSVMHKFGGKWQIIEFNNINQMYEFILSRK